MAVGGNTSRQSSNLLIIENDEKVKSDFDDAREKPNSLIPTPITREELKVGVKDGYFVVT